MLLNNPVSFALQKVAEAIQALPTSQRDLVEARLEASIDLADEGDITLVALIACAVRDEDVAEAIVALGLLDE